jgi:hypothetical protein
VADVQSRARRTSLGRGTCHDRNVTAANRPRQLGMQEVHSMYGQRLIITDLLGNQTELFDPYPKSPNLNT